MNKKIVLLVLIAIFSLAIFSACNKTPQLNETFTVEYNTSIGGHIDGETKQQIKKGDSSSAVTAVADEGYRFVKWSDDITDNPRSDVNVQSDISVIAEFEKLIFTVIYSASDHGHVEGELNQTVIYGKMASTVTAIADKGYRFVKWSDGITDNPRTDVNVQSDINAIAQFEKLTFTVTYSASAHGHLEGKLNQTIKYGENSSAVTAVADENYIFVKWSDGITDNPRTDVNVQSDINVIAQFEIALYTYTYIYNNATENISEKYIVISYYDDLSKLTLSTPQRINSIFEGWYLEKDFKTQVTDKNGNIIIDRNVLLNSDSNKFYAKFSLINEAKYNILMVYVTEIDATFDLADISRDENGYPVIVPKGTRTIQYKMSEQEKEVCHKATLYFEELLNAMFCGLVEFKVDELFTTQVIHRESFDQYITPGFGYEYALYANDIPEISTETLDNYQSIITSVDLCDEDIPILHTMTGLGKAKYGCMFLDSEFYTLKLNHGEDYLELFLNPLHIYYVDTWLTFLSPYIHELTHTIERQIYNHEKMIYDYHEVLELYPGDESYELFGYYSHIGIAHLYLLRQVEYDGKKYGIPYDFWLGKRDETIWDIVE